MPDVCQDQPIFCLEEIVVFVVSGDIYIGSLSYCGRSEEGSGTAADGYFPDLRFTDCSVTDDFTTESLFYLLQESQAIGWLGEFADDSETRYRIGIIQVNDVPFLSLPPGEGSRSLRHRDDCLPRRERCLLLSG